MKPVMKPVNFLSHSILILCLFGDTAAATLALDVRLSGGTAGEGRVEVKYAGSWGSICDNHWTATEAQVICRQKGFST